MRRPRTPLSWRPAGAAVGVTMVLALAPASPAGAAPTATDQPSTGSTVARYRAVDLGTLGGQSSVATAINDRGAVVGRAQTADGTWHGFLWRGGAMSDLGLFSPTDINNKGVVVGTRDDSGGAYRWMRGRFTRLGDRMSHPIAVNDRGQVIGLMGVDGGPDVPALWARGSLRALPLDSVSGINNRGQVAGGRASATGFHAAVWHRGRVTDLGAAAFDRGNAYGINDRGWVLGWTFSAEQDERGTLWRRGRTTDLGTLGGNFTHAIAINNRGAILAASQVPDGNVHPALWKRGVLSDLTTAGVWADSDMVGLNNRGEIVASIRPEFGIARATLYRPRR